MSEAQVAGSLDRLPWLADEPKAPIERGRQRDLTSLAAASVLVVAAVSFWLGSRGTVETVPQPSAARSSAAPLVRLPRLPSSRPSFLRASYLLSHPSDSEAIGATLFPSPLAGEGA